MSNSVDENVKVEELNPNNDSNTPQTFAESVDSQAFLKKNKLNKPGSNKWNQERRLEFIEYRLCWNNQINRADLVNFFMISIPQASLDLSKYIEMAPDNLIYDRHEKVYLKSANFKPIYPYVADPMTYLNDALLFSTDRINKSFIYLDNYPPVGSFVAPKRVLDYEVLTKLIYCIQNGRAVTIEYQSANSTVPMKRLIVPHALAYDNIRWHVRAYCFARNDFRDFVISRIISIGDIEPASVNSNEDMNWNIIIPLTIAANPDLPEAQRIAIEKEYGMKDGEVKYKCRRAMLLYTLRTLRLSPDDDEFNKYRLDKFIRENKDPEAVPPYPPLILKNKIEIYMLLRA